MGDDGLSGIWRKIHPRQVIWVLLVGLIGVTGLVGSTYKERLENTEAGLKRQEGEFIGWRREQNGHLRDIDSSMRHIHEAVVEMKATQAQTIKAQNELLLEQRSLKSDVEWIKREIKR